MHVFDVWGAAAAKSLVTDNGQTVVSLTEADQRFVVDGGLYAVAAAPSGSFLAVGGAEELFESSASSALRSGTAAAARWWQATWCRRAIRPSRCRLGRYQCTIRRRRVLAFAPAPQTLLAAGSVDGSLAIFDTARNFSVRRHIREAHEAFPVVKVDFVRSASGAGAQGAQAAGWLLTSCGMDGVVRRWDLRGVTASQNVPNAATAGLVKEWRGHRGDGEGGGVLSFVQGETGERVVTAGDDGVVLVFEA